MDDLKTILDRIRKPLAFAGRDNYAHIKSLAALEPFMRSQIEDLKQIVKDRHAIAEIERLFAGFDALSLEKNGSAGERHEAHDGFQCCRLAGAVAPEKNANLSGMAGEAHVEQDLRRSVEGIDLTQLEHRGRWRGLGHGREPR